jgi:hypothetical protein
MPDISDMVFGAAIAAIVIGVTSTALRFMAVRRAGRRYAAEDWFALAALFVLVIYASMVFTVNDLMGSLGVPPDMDRLRTALIVLYAMMPQFVFNQLFAKLSLLCLYQRLFGVSNAYRRTLYVIGGLNVAWAIATLPLYLFACDPISMMWEPMTPGTCMDNATAVAGAESVNSLIDFMLVLFPLVPLYQLHLDNRLKFKLSLVFLLGAFAGIIGFIKIGITYANEDSTEASSYTGFWAIIQMTCSMICCNAPVYKPLLPQDGFVQLFMSSVRSLSRRPSRTFDQSEPHSFWGIGSTQDVHGTGGKQSHDTTEPLPTWLPSDIESHRVLTWVDTDAEAGKDERTTEAEAYNMRTIQVHRQVEVDGGAETAKHHGKH